MVGYSGLFNHRLLVSSWHGSILNTKNTVLQIIFDFFLRANPSVFCPLGVTVHT